MLNTGQICIGKWHCNIIDGEETRSTQMYTYIIYIVHDEKNFRTAQLAGRAYLMSYNSI